MREIYVVSMQRSGTHAIINWMVDSLAATGHVQGYLDPFNPLAMADRRPMKLARDDTSTVIVSVEDRTIADAEQLLKDAALDGYLPIGKDLSPTLLVILRDPFNLFASRRMFNQRCQLGNTSQEALDCWKEHAAFALDGGTTCRYNHWCHSVEYRKRSANDFGFHSNDSTIETVSTQGNGSSFDGMHFDGGASQMATGERWKTFQHHASFWNLFDDPELLKLSASFFGGVTEQVHSYLKKEWFPCQSKPDSSTASIESSKPTQEESPPADTVQP